MLKLKPFFKNLCTLAIAVCCTIAFVTSCDDDEETVSVSSVSLDNSTLLMIEGQSQTLKATIAPEKATNKSITYQSSATSVATVNESGKVEAISAGTAIITVTTVDGGKTATCEVTVQRPTVSVTGVSLNKTELSLFVGEKEILIATVAPAGATIQTVTWGSSDDAVATVNESGEVEAISIGTATITVTTLDGNKTATCELTVDAGSFTVKFETNGGSVMEDIVVDKGAALAEPTAPTIENGPGEGLYLGNVDPEEGVLTFGGWYTDADFENEYDFSSPVMNNFTLYAKWDGDLPEPINLDGITGSDIVEKAYSYLAPTADFVELIEYTLVLANDYTVNNNLPHFSNPNVSLRIIGKGEERVIRKTNNGNLFYCNAGTLILDKNIKITGSNGNFYLFWMLASSTLIMKDGSKVSDVSAGNQGIIHISDGNSTFIMEGGEICNNTVDRTESANFAATVCISWGKFYMEGGLISGNTVKSSFNSHNIAGGVYINNWNQFHKTGGIIRDNTAEITAAEAGDGRTGQQVFYSANNNARTFWKVDNNLDENDDISTSDTSNALWIPVD